MENLEENYSFKQEEGKESCGMCGSIIYGKLINNTTQEEKFVALKKAISNAEVQQLRFEKEKYNFKTLQQKPQDGIVKCYGVINIGGEKYIVMEDLTKQNFKSIDDICKELLFLEGRDLDVNIDKKRACYLDKLSNNIYKLKIQKEQLKSFKKNMKKK